MRVEIQKKIEASKDLHVRNLPTATGRHGKGWILCVSPRSKDDESKDS